MFDGTKSLPGMPGSPMPTPEQEFQQRLGEQVTVEVKRQLGEMVFALTQLQAENRFLSNELAAVRSELVKAKTPADGTSRD